MKPAWLERLLYRTDPAPDKAVRVAKDVFYPKITKRTLADSPYPTVQDRMLAMHQLGNPAFGGKERPFDRITRLHEMNHIDGEYPHTVEWETIVILRDELVKFLLLSNNGNDYNPEFSKHRFALRDVKSKLSDAEKDHDDETIALAIIGATAMYYRLTNYHITLKSNGSDINYYQLMSLARQRDAYALGLQLKHADFKPDQNQEIHDFLQEDLRYGLGESNLEGASLLRPSDKFNIEMREYYATGSIPADTHYPQLWQAIDATLKRTVPQIFATEITPDKPLTGTLTDAFQQRAEHQQLAKAAIANKIKRREHFQAKHAARKAAQESGASEGRANYKF